MCPTITTRWPHWRDGTATLNLHPRFRRDGFVEFVARMEPTGRANARPMTGSAQSGTVAQRTEIPGLRFALPGLRDHSHKNKTAGDLPAVVEKILKEPIRPQR